MYLIKTPVFVQRLFPTLTWRIPVKSKTVFLTFDDGPIPKVTPWVLDQLDEYNAKATFFCVGDNIRKHPDIAQMISVRGHAMGNHTFNHLNGYNTDSFSYYHNVQQCAGMLSSSLFRPPHGRLKRSQVRLIQKEYEIIMWDVLSGDFDKKLDGEQCFKNVINNVNPGSIIVFHDSKKAWDRLSYALPKTLEELSNKGYSFESLREKTSMKEKVMLEHVA